MPQNEKENGNGDGNSKRTEHRNADKIGLMPLTKRDRRIAIKMLERDVVDEEMEWRRELQAMLMLNLKAEIQILSSGVGGLEAWLDRKLSGGV